MPNENQNEYMLLFRNTNWHKGLSPKEMQSVATQWMDWFKKLSDQGIATSGRPLESTGKIVSGKGGRNVVDGPFAESKEAIGGYFMLQVATLDEALEIAKQCPGLAYGSQVEVRPLLEVCPMAGKEAGADKLATAGAA